MNVLRRHSRFICSVTSALEACVMLELEARQVKVVSTFLRCTVPTISDDDTTVVAAALAVAFCSLRCSTVTLSDTDTGMPLISQCRSGAGRPEKERKKGDESIKSVHYVSYGPSPTNEVAIKCQQNLFHHQSSHTVALPRTYREERQVSDYVALT